MTDSERKLLDDTFHQLNEIEEENIEGHLKDNQELLSALDNSILKYTCLSYNLIKYQEKLPININHVQFFVTSIANNAIVIKKLFSGGWHLQCQSIMRVQYEQINIALSIICDNRFFEKYHKLQEIKKEEAPYTPKQKETKNIIRKYLIDQKGKDFWNSIESLMDFLYNELSRSTHGNFLHIALLAYSIEKDKISPGIGGNKKSMPRTVYTLQEMNNYSQIMFSFLLDLIEEEKIIEFKGTELESEFVRKFHLVKK